MAELDNTTHTLVHSVISFVTCMPVTVVNDKYSIFQDQTQVYLGNYLA